MENNNSNVKETIKEFFKTYGGAVIGGLVAVILCFTKLYQLLVWVALVIGGMFLGNYVQNNKEVVKEKLKQIIDKF